MGLQYSGSQGYPRAVDENVAIRVAIVDGFPLLNVALRSVLGNEDDVELVGEAHNASGALDLLRTVRAQVAVLETSLPDKDPLELAREINQLKGAPKLLVLSGDATPHYALRMLRAGAHGFMSTRSAAEKVVGAVHALADNRTYLPPELQEILTERYLRQGLPQLPEEMLSDREFQVMRLLALGYTNREVASKLFIGVKTVDTHRANMLRKLNLRNNADIARFAIQNRFVQCSQIEARDDLDEARP